MLDISQFIQQISTTINKDKVVELSKIWRENNFALHDLIDITFNENKDIAFRASWILENVFLNNPEAYLNDLEYLLKSFIKVEYPSCQRHYAKIMMYITSPKAILAIQMQLQEIDLEPIVEKLFDWLIDPIVKTAIKVTSADALYHLSGRYPWIADELANQLKHLMRNGSAGVQVRGKTLLRKLQSKP